MSHLHPQRGSSATPILVFFGIVILSVIFFFVFTLPKAATEKEAAQAAEQAAAAAQAAEVVKPAPAVPAPSETAPVVPETPKRFSTPRGFLEVVSQKLAAGDVKAAGELLGADALAGDSGTAFSAVFGEAGFRPAPGKGIVEIGDFDEKVRFAIPLSDSGVAGNPGSPAGASPAPVKVAGSSLDLPPPPPITLPGAADPAPVSAPAIPTLPAPGDPSPAPVPTLLPPNAPSAATAPAKAAPAKADPADLKLEFDLARDDEKGWKAAAVHFPKGLLEAVAAKIGRAKLPASVLNQDDSQDPLRVAEVFLKAVLKQDYAVARAVTDTEKVTREKVAGLCIVFEEGQYRMADQRPISAPVAQADTSWVLIKVHSDRDNSASDFGLEMQRNASKEWRIIGVNFSNLLAAYVKASGAGGAAYSPLVKNPKGGESLVLYFEFNESGLHPRAQRQLQIVANLLRDDPNRKIRISGFSDAVGSHDYNVQLSGARALSVKDQLAAVGVSPAQIVTEGFGELKPLDPNVKPDGSDNPDGRSRNRRTEIFLDF